MEEGEAITRGRLALWNTYHQWLAEGRAGGQAAPAHRSPHCAHNAHMYYVLLPDLATRTAFIDKLRRAEINTVFHYIPLHSSPAGRRYARAHGEQKVTDEMSERLVRLPLWAGLEEHQVSVIQKILAVL